MEMSCLRMNTDMDVAASIASRKETLLRTPLAFATEPSLLSATSRLLVELPDDNKKKHVRLMNVEVFEPSSGEETNNGAGDALPLVIYIPGVCESAETLSVQNLAQACCRPTPKEGLQQQLPSGGKVRLAVIELIGHGLSDGTPGVCPNFDALVVQALHCVHAITKQLLPIKSSNCDASSSNPSRLVLCGSSLGGTLALYAAEYLSRQLSKTDCLEKWPCSSTSHPPPSVAMEALEELDWSHLVIEQYSGCQLPPSFYFAGVLSITPAVGVDPRALPPSWMVSALSVAASLLPSATQVPLTPFEDPSHYNCPSDTQRNFSGHWPLSTSRMLLDLTSKRVPNNLVATSSGKNDHVGTSLSSPAVLSLRCVPQVVMIAGAKDTSIPVESIRSVHECLRSPSKEVHVLQKAGHDVLVRRRSSAEVASILQSILFVPAEDP